MWLMWGYDAMTVCDLLIFQDTCFLQQVTKRRVTEDAIVSRLKSIMLLNLRINYSFWNFLNPPNILEIIPTKIDLLSNIHANLANQHKEKHNQLQITTLNRHEMLSTKKIFPQL